MAITVIVHTKTGQSVAVRNEVGWDNFLLQLSLTGAVIAGDGLYIARDNIAIMFRPEIAQAAVHGVENKIDRVEGTVVYLNPKPVPQGDPGDESPPRAS